MLDICKEWGNPNRKIACIEGDFELDPRSISAQRFKQARIWNFRGGLTVAEFFDNRKLKRRSAKRVRRSHEENIKVLKS
jgi:hypothetical protein